MWKNWKRIQKILIIAVAVLLVLTGVFSLYFGNYYYADLEAITAYSLGMGYEKMERLEDGSLVFYPAEYDSALIFYPGAKVEVNAYMTLMARCAQEGVLAVLMPMPFNMAALAKDAAAAIPAEFPEVEHWYMAGHSHGGSVAAMFAAENTSWIDGLILLAAYSTEDVTTLPVLSIYGSEDGVLNLEKYEQYRPNLPADSEEHILDGGNHACFGVYGEQEGDGTATITNLEQIEMTAKLIADFIK